ncbi:MAG: hypothetical protein K0S74_791 [Chlamydiales bacterium]|jgi:thioesterase domain-containing protein|nr:hypothetical protein [Chlamydiales bacterium]
MNLKELELYLHKNIPLSTALGVEVSHISMEKLILRAPIGPNLNHKKTAFGGSLHAVTTLACWSLLYYWLYLEKLSCEIVISHSEIDYLQPIKEDFCAECHAPKSADWAKFVHCLNRKGKARIQLAATIQQQEKLAVDYIGSFVAIAAPICL